MLPKNGNVDQNNFHTIGKRLGIAIGMPVDPINKDIKTVVACSPCGNSINHIYFGRLTMSYRFVMSNKICIVLTTNLRLV